MHCGSGVGFTTVAAWEGLSDDNNGANVHATPREHKLLNFKVVLLPSPLLKAKGGFAFESERLRFFSPPVGREWAGAHLDGRTSVRGSFAFPPLLDFLLIEAD